MDKHDTLLIACGTPDNRRHLRDVLQERYNLLEAANAQQLMLLLRQNVECIAALVLDMTQPEKVDGALLQQEENTALLSRVPVILIGGDSPQMLNQGFSQGAADVIPLDYEPYAMLRRIETIVELHLHKQYLEAMVQEQALALCNTNQTMVDALSSIIEYRSVESGQHILRIRHFTKILLEEVVRSCPEYAMTETDIRSIASASALHDIGKIAIPDSILMKPGGLTAEEMEIMKTHAITGCRILDSLGNLADKNYLRYAHNICHYHHERWDGRGYPEGLRGDQIPICAQVVGLADVYDALTTKRVYKDAYSFAQAVNMILKGDCGVFSPKLLECFKHVAYSFEELARSYADGLSPKTEDFDTTLPAPRRLEENSLDRVRAKYTALVHYINGLLMEVDLEKDLFHLIYNPFPELSWLSEVTTLSDMVRLLNERILDEKGRQDLIGFFQNGIQTFMEEDLRRSTHYFNFKSKQQPEGELFEVTLLRINPIDAARRTLAVLCRRVEDVGYGPEERPLLSDATFVCRNESGFTLVRLGSHVPQLAGYTPDELQHAFAGRLMELVVEEDRQHLWRSIQQQLERGNQAEAEFRIRKKNGQLRWISERARLSLDTDGREILSCYLTDITDTRLAFDQLNDKLTRYEIILAQTENVLFDWDVVSDRIVFSDTWEKLFGFSPVEQTVRESLAEGSFFHPDDLPLLLDCIAHLENGSSYEMTEVRVATARGRYLWCRVRASAIRDKQNALMKIVGIIINIDAEKQAAHLLQDRAERDSLTKLLNKTAGRKQAEEYLNRFPGSSAMLIIDLDNFKDVNDRYGHLFGDAVLTKTAREIEKLFRSQDIVSRIGGDEFLVLMRGVNDRQLIAGRCQRLLNIFGSSFRSGRQRLPIGCSIGIALSPEHGSSYYELFNRADQALYQAKAEGKNTYCFFDPGQEILPLDKGRATAVGNAIDSDEEPGLAEDNLVRHAFHKLYTAEDPEEGVNSILAMVGKEMKVSRVYVFENSPDNRFCSNTYEWCAEGIPSEKDKLQNISYERDIPDYQSHFDDYGVFYVPEVRALPQHLLDILAPQGIRSMLHCAFWERGVFRGYIGFDECVEERMWTKDQIRLLQYFSEMLGTFLLYQNQRRKALIQTEELRTILDNQSGWLYIIEPETYTLKYCNEKTAGLSSGIRPGEKCHQALFRRNKPCPGCPVAKLPQFGTCATILTDEKKGIRILTEATAITWQGEDSCLMSCRRLPE